MIRIVFRLSDGQVSDYGEGVLNSVPPGYAQVQRDIEPDTFLAEMVALDGWRGRIGDVLVDAGGVPVSIARPAAYIGVEDTHAAARALSSNEYLIYGKEF